ncbi:hypothetical protein BOSE62_150227 [Bosea sp. 62]|nr:hypothetical protein BOSE21B_10834 [Bosea sp. 21B]CAD5263042.1 hypothetical protein BOSE7B_150302 [Bosea sp. 7B]VVT43859.1 hypothetical protein BOS5A_10236 [Bosea sp. EC-HK365B]VXB74124.1 hypothetical protein BOSE62_150227 [Bosea sp. 62]VXC37403.1 hypothetical protein BOSE127_180302 [Bosea sp. 127]
MPIFFRTDSDFPPPASVPPEKSAEPKLFTASPLMRPSPDRVLQDDSFGSFKTKI